MKNINSDNISLVKEFIFSNFDDIAVFCLDKQLKMELSDEEKLQINNEKKFIDQFKSKQWTKNQHYVPQFYLKKFCNNNWQLETLDVLNKKIIKTQSIEGVCSDTYFYSMETWKEDIISQVLENLFCYYENNFVEIYDRLVDSILNYKNIDEKDLYELCTFVTVSRVRSKYFRDQINDWITEMMKNVASITYNMEKSLNSNDSKIEMISSNKKAEKLILSGNYILETDNSHHIGFIGEEKHIIWFSNLLFNKKIRIYISDWVRDFVTSDCCVVEACPERQWVYWFSFMEKVHYFVLSPKILIEFSDERKPGKKIKRKVVDRTRVTYYNLIRSIYSKYMYSNLKSNFIKEEYLESRSIYIDELADFYKSIFSEDKRKIDDMKKYAKKCGFFYLNNYELVKKIGKITSDSKLLSAHH